VCSDEDPAQPKINSKNYFLKRAQKKKKKKKERNNFANEYMIQRYF